MELESSRRGVHAIAANDGVELTDVIVIVSIQPPTENWKG